MCVALFLKLGNLKKNKICKWYNKIILNAKISQIK
jgi:hypothetical protein